MAFREPAGFAPAAVRRRASSKPKRKAATKPGVRRKTANAGGRTKTRGSTKKTSAKETGKMAKRRTKRRRTAAQKAATRKMIAANKRRKSTKRNPTSRKRKASTRKPVGIRKSKKTGSTSVVRRGTSKMTPRAETYTKRVSGQLGKARGKKRTTIYRTRPSGKVTKIIRENPANRTKAIVSAVAGFSAGYIAADMLDRYIATRGENGNAITDQAGVKAAITKKASGTRIFAQAAGTGVSAVGAYMLRKKSVVGTYLLGGVAAAFATKAFAMVVKDHLMPALLKPKTDSGDFVKRMGYYGSVSGPRGYMGAPRPFRGKPTVIGPQAGSVGSYGCTRTPVSPSAYYDQGGRENCKPWPFTQSASQDCIDAVSQAPSGGTPPMTRQPPPTATPSPDLPRPGNVPPPQRQPGDGREIPPSVEPERRVYATPQMPPMRPTAPATPRTPGRAPGSMPSIRPVDRLKAQQSASATRQPATIPRLTAEQLNRQRQVK